MMPQDPVQSNPTISSGKPPAAIAALKTSIQTSYQGPLPPPGDLAAYNQALPGGAERIMQMAEREQAHCHKMEKRVLRHNALALYSGQLSGFVLGALGILMGGFLLYHGKGLGGFSVFLTSVGSLVGIFLWTHRRRSERESHQVRPSNS